MPNPYKILKEAFTFNILLVKSLLHLVPKSDRKQLVLWVNKLTSRYDNPEELSVRNEYTWYMLVMLQSEAIGPPFTSPPPPGKLPELISFIPHRVYRELLESTFAPGDLSERISDMKEATQERTPGKSSRYSEGVDEEKVQGSDNQSTKFVHPAEFFNWQPKPPDGSFCYACVFSNYEG